MKSRLLLISTAVVLLCLPFCGHAQIAIDKVHFPDSVFRDYVRENFDRDGNDTLSEWECVAVTEIDVSGEFNKISSLADLAGVEYFPSLTVLNCFYTELTSLDVSRNPALEHLDCSFNQLKSLDVTRNTALRRLYCNDIGMTSLDVTQNTLLETLYCCNSDLSNLDVSRNSVLSLLDCSNTDLTSLDVSHNPKLAKLYCSRTGLTSLDVSQNPDLEYLACSNTELTNLDVSRNPKLTDLDFAHTGLTSLDVSRNPLLWQLECSYTGLTNLDVSHNPKLHKLECSRTGLTSLDLSQNPVLKSLRCDYTGLTSLDVSGNPDLEELLCSYTALTSLDVSRNPNLIILDCYHTRAEVASEAGGTYNLDLLPNFDPDRASDWKGGSVEGKILTFNDTVVTYKYDILCADKDKAVPSTLEFKLVTNPNLNVLPVVFSPVSGSVVRRGDTVRLSCSTEGSRIYYGLGQGAEPTEEYTAASHIVISEDTTYLTARSMREGRDTSGVVDAVYYATDEPEPADTLEVILPSELEAEVDGQTVKFGWKSEEGYVYGVRVSGSGREDTVGKEVESEGKRTGFVLAGLNEGTYGWAVRVVRVDGTDTLSEYVHGEDFVVGPASSETAGLSGIRLYPNPTTGVFNLQVPESVRLEIFTAAGLRILGKEIEAGTHPLELDGSGLYLLRLTVTDGRSCLKRLVVR